MFIQRIGQMYQQANFAFLYFVRNESNIAYSYESDF